MSHWNIAVVAHPGPRSAAESLCPHLTEDWTGHPRALFTATTFRELDAEAMDQLDALVLMVDDASKHTDLVRPLTMLEELHVPIVALLDHSPQADSVFEHAAVLVQGRDTPPEIICARLHGMLHRQREINRLRRDLAVARRSHLGLGDEVARMHDELEFAAQAQRELLPRELPALHGVRLAALWRPAQYVSGDIYDAVQLDDDHVGLFLADAVGHGVSAALMTMVICQSLTTQVREGSSWRILEPAEVLTRLNDHMIRRRLQARHRFATAVYAVIDCRSRRMAMAGAGHPPPLLHHGDGSCETLTTEGGLLGVFEDEKYDQVEIDLSVGDRLLLYTDGFEQAFPQDGQETGYRLPTTRYREEFQKLCTHENPHEMIETICRRLDAQSGSLHPVDDLTLLCLHAGPLVQPDRLAA